MYYFMCGFAYVYNLLTSRYNKINTRHDDLHFPHYFGVQPILVFLVIFIVYYNVLIAQIPAVLLAGSMYELA